MIITKLSPLSFLRCLLLREGLIFKWCPLLLVIFLIITLFFVAVTLVFLAVTLVAIAVSLVTIAIFVFLIVGRRRGIGAGGCFYTCILSIAWRVFEGPTSFAPIQFHM